MVFCGIRDRSFLKSAQLDDVIMYLELRGKSLKVSWLLGERRYLLKFTGDRQTLIMMDVP